jgi:flagellar hook protein FlgE
MAFKVALARFANPNGLKEASENMFKTAPNSGIPQIGIGGTGGRGQIRGGYLEEANVDLAEQFTELIIGQRAFQANARTVTTLNELLQELVNMV